MEILTVLYMIITTVMVIVYWNTLTSPVDMLIWRAGVLGVLIVTNVLYHLHPCRLLVALRVIPPLLGLIWWYPETYEFCSQLPYLDHVFAGIDQQMFGCQPSLEFDKLLSGQWWSESFCFGYYAYYYMMVATVLYYLFFQFKHYERASFIFLGSFFIYYLIYEILPVAGPQYYFGAMGENCLAVQGHFPELGHYFDGKTVEQMSDEMLKLDIKGIFSQLVVGAQEVGERPTAAFPSSHVGMSTVTMLLAYRSGNKWLFWIMVPVYMLLCCATVYIKAHYLIDSICGFVSAVLFFCITNWIYSKVSKSPIFYKE